MSANILGLPGAVFWLWFSALIYGIAIILILGPLRREKSELMYAFFAFLAGMAWLHLFIGAGTYWKQMLLSHIGFFGGLTGTVYTLKFPLLALSESKRKPLFYLALIVAWLIVVWMLIFPHKSPAMIWVGYLYMITTAGLISGFYIVWQGIKAKESWVKVKTIGGGAGVITCCLAADVLVLYTLATGIKLWIVSGHFFMWLAPVILILAIYLGRYLQRVSESPKVS
jgi:hypothetical protein